MTEKYEKSPLESVVTGVREQILSGKYPPESRLPTEPKLQSEWGVSRSVVREAMKMLVSQGLIRIEQGRGMFVSSQGNAPLKQQLEWTLMRDARFAARSSEGVAQKDSTLEQWDALLDIRQVLEVGAAQRAAVGITNDELLVMAESIESMRSHPMDAVACADDDLVFHGAIAAATRNPLYPAILNSLNDLLHVYLELSHHGSDNALKTAEQHQAIYDAIRAKDVNGSADAMRNHLESSVHDLALARQKQKTPSKEKFKIRSKK
jgi:GntR family transcriptional repressor for pyruvate dehydrogenase complex